MPRPRQYWHNTKLNRRRGFSRLFPDEYAYYYGRRRLSTRGVIRFQRRIKNALVRNASIRKALISKFGRDIGGLIYKLLTPKPAAL